MSEPGKYTKEDFVSPADVRWCPGCGDYAILRTMQKVLPDIGVAKENIVFVSGIGCSSRFPFYVDTFGFHTLHGRAPTVASGIKCVQPGLDLWLVTGDGDALSIGGNHLLHVLRRNFNLKILLFNNRIYGLTKGQYSPTSVQGQVTKSSPLGAVDNPVFPIPYALGAEATLVARTADNQLGHMEDTFRAVAKHRGTAFVEVLQNCVIFNHGAWEGVAGKATRDDTQLMVEHGQPLRFGKNGAKGIVQKGFSLQVADVASVGEGTLVVHDQHLDDPGYAMALSRLGIDGASPTAMGILRQVQRPTYEDSFLAEQEKAQAKGRPALKDMFRGFGKVSTWEVN